MINNQSIINLIRKRFSCRSYHRDPIPSSKQKQLRDFLSTLNQGPLGTRSRFKLIAADDVDRQALKGLSTYGFIKNPTGFILGATSTKAHSVEDFGYLMEYAVLHATGLDLGTVWLGGTFNKGRYAEKMQLTEGEHLPAVIAAGLAADKPRVIDAVIRRQAHAQNRKSWNQLFSLDSFDTPIERATAGTYAVVLDIVQRAPSAYNKQPWRIVKEGDAWHFYMQRTRGYAARNARFAGVADMQRIDMGIAMCHFALTAAELALSGHWELQEPAIHKPNTLMEYSVSWVAEA